MRAPRYVVTGPPDSGKSTWVRSQARDGDLVFDFDALASLMTLGGRERPRGADGSRGPWPETTAAAMLTIRDALVLWLKRASTPTTRVYLIVRDSYQAQTVAAQIEAELVWWSRAKWE